MEKKEKMTTQNGDTMTNHSSTVQNKVESKTDLQQKKDMLHTLIDNLTILDYVEVTSRILNVTEKNAQTIHQIFIEKNGNLIVREAHEVPMSRFDDEE